MKTKFHLHALSLCLALALLFSLSACSFYSDDEIEKIRSEAYADGHEEGYKDAYDEGYDEGHEDAMRIARSNDDRLADLQSENDDLKNEMKSMESEHIFFRNNACIVTTQGEKYHHYGCYHIQGRNYYIYNTENAIGMGYTPCLDCWETGLVQ
jgi:hypothetical protein